jgi:hypothetical protein
MSKLGSFPFCAVPFRTGAQGLQGTYPIGFTAEQIRWAYSNVSTYHFNITAVPDLLDANLEILQAMSILNIGLLAGLGIAVAPILGSAAQRTGVIGDMTRRMDTSKCTGTKFVFNQNLCYFEIDFGDVVRVQSGSGRAAGSFLYFPKVVLIFFASGYVFANDLRFLLGAGTIIGGVDWKDSSGVITDINAVSGDGPPIGNPSVFGEVIEKDLLAEPVC